MSSSRNMLILGCIFYLCISVGRADNAPLLDLSQSRGIVVARAKASIATDLVARVEELKFAPGQKFRAGDTLVRFDCKRYEAEHRAAEAKLRAKKGVLESNLKLASRRAIGTTELQVSRAEVDQARAELEALSVRTSQCTITAPYAGRVVEVLINEHEMPQANTPLIQIVDDESLEIELIVPSQWLTWLKPRMPLQFRIDETQTSYRSEILRLGSIVDPISQTIKLTAAFQDNPVDVLPGMSEARTLMVHPQKFNRARRWSEHNDGATSRLESDRGGDKRQLARTRDSDEQVERRPETVDRKWTGNAALH